jgi:6-phosphofructo-2-kinase/fructose-2,6-biphosphatase 2
MKNHRKIYITRHGESINNILNIIGGNSELSKNGIKYSNYLEKYFRDINIEIYTSSLKRTIQTGLGIKGEHKIIPELNEIYSGDFEGLKLNELKIMYPIEYTKRNEDKYNNKYPNGESYKDLKHKIYPILDMIDMYDKRPLLIICHKAICRILYSYFSNKSLKNSTNIDIDLHKLYII